MFVRAPGCLPGSTSPYTGPPSSGKKRNLRWGVKPLKKKKMLDPVDRKLYTIRYHEIPVWYIICEDIFRRNRVKYQKWTFASEKSGWATNIAWPNDKWTCSFKDKPFQLGYPRVMHTHVTHPDWCIWCVTHIQMFLKFCNTHPYHPYPMNIN